MKLAFIVNAFENFLELQCSLASLKLQWPSKAFSTEIHVADNSLSEICINDIRNLCSMMGVNYHKTEGHCYTASQAVSKLVEADYLCFASSDGYYVPGFSVIMMEVALRLKSDLVYCNTLYDPRLHGRGIYSVLDSVPEMRWIDKTNFIVRKELFTEWPSHPQNWCDGQFVENLMRDGKKLDKAKGVLVVHN